MKILRTFRTSTGKQKLELIFWIRAMGIVFAIGMSGIRILYCYTNLYTRPGFCHTFTPNSTVDFAKNIVGHASFLYVVSNGVHLWLLRTCISENSEIRWKLYICCRVLLDIWGTVLWVVLSISEESGSDIGITYYLHIIVTPLIIVLFGTLEILLVRHCYKKLNSQTMHDIKTIIRNKKSEAERQHSWFGIENIEKFFISPLDVHVEYSKFLGGGQYGMVFRGNLRTNETKSVIAVKILKNIENNDLGSLVNEIKTYIHAGTHSNLITFYGISSDATNPRSIFLLVELCTMGCLSKYLQENSAGFSSSTNENFSTYINMDRALVTPSTLIAFVFDILYGMTHLSSKGIIHGDLAARNVLLAKHSLRPIAKITDFGLSTKLENYKTYIRCNQGMALPWKWMSIEALTDFKFSEKSDVWAFAVLLWEIFSLGGNPYGNVHCSNFSELIQAGLRLCRPINCPETIYAEMLNCWNPVEDKRPSFKELIATFKLLVNKIDPNSLEM